MPFVIPAQAGIYSMLVWIPAFAGMTPKIYYKIYHFNNNQIKLLNTVFFNSTSIKIKSPAKSTRNLYFS